MSSVGSESDDGVPGLGRLAVFHWDNEEMLDGLDLEQLVRARTQLDKAIDRRSSGIVGDPCAGLPPRAKSPEGQPVRIYVDGCFDLMHSGHYNALRQAKKLIEPCVLVAGVHSDKEITAAKGMPVFNNDERLALVKACKWVDEVVFDTPYCPSLKLLDDLKCNYVAHGDDITATYKEVQDEGRLLIIKRTEGVSTTDIVGRLLLMTRDHHSTPTGETTIHRSMSLPDLNLEKAGKSSFLPTTRRMTQFANSTQPKAGDKVIYIDGDFDLFHPGHVEALKQAKALGDFLYVGLHGDQVINEKQGANYPICTLHERALCVLACKYVDEVIFSAPWEVTKEVITLLDISVVVECANTKFPHEGDTANRSAQMEECYRAPHELGICHSLDCSVDGPNTSDVITRIVDNRMSLMKKFEKKSAAEEEYKEQRVHVREM